MFGLSMEMAESGSGIKHLEVHIIERISQGVTGGKPRKWVGLKVTQNLNTGQHDGTSQRDHWGKMYHALSHVEDISL